MASRRVPDRLPAGCLRAVRGVRPDAIRGEDAHLPRRVHQRERTRGGRFRPGRRRGGRTRRQGCHRTGYDGDRGIHGRRLGGAHRGQPRGDPLRRPDRWPLPRAAGRRRQHRDAEAGRHDPDGPHGAGPGPRCSDRWLPALVPGARSGTGERAVRATDLGPAGAGRDHQLVPGADRRAHQHPGRPGSADRAGGHEPRRGARVAGGPERPVRQSGRRAVRTGGDPQGPQTGHQHRTGLHQRGGIEHRRPAGAVAGAVHQDGARNRPRRRHRRGR